jgi:glutamine---fructose-6-phosphate transaminase (isomerizing)
VDSSLEEDLLISQEPELRPHPPWIMDEMITAQLELPGPIAESPSPALLEKRIDEALSAGEPVVFCGCGTSEHAGRAAAAIVRNARTGAEVHTRDAFEVRLDPPRRGVVVGISHSAETAATLEAVQKSQEGGARSLLITAAPELAPDGIAVVPTPVYDRSWCHTVAYTSPFLTVALALGSKQDAVRSTIEEEVGARDERARDAQTLRNCDRFLVVASGVDEITAAELALKIEEAAHIPCTPLGIEKVLHGHLPAATARTGLILLRYDCRQGDKRDQRSEDVMAACGVLDMARVTLRSDVETLVDALLAGAVAAQLLTVEIATALGVNPDLIRREEPLYRRVAEVGKAG